MIEGARVHPSYTYAQHLGRVPKSCDRCKETQTVTTRQMMGCPYEVRVSDATPWAPPSWRRPNAPKLTACPGYTTALPAVIEAAEAHPQWKAGTLTDYLDGRRPTRPGLDVIAAYDVGLHAFEAERQREALDAGRAGK